MLKFFKSFFFVGERIRSEAVWLSLSISAMPYLPKKKVNRKSALLSNNQSL